MTTKPVSSPSAAPAATSRRGVTAALAALALALAAAAAPAAPTADPAAARVESLHAALLEIMKGGASLGVKGRDRQITPAVQADFDLATMTRFAVGPTWAQMTQAQRDALTAAFGRLTAASYADNFASYGGERFVVDPNVQTRGSDKIVQSQLIPAHDKPVALLYRMRQAPDGGWKIIDVYYDGISQLTTRRSDFAQPLASGGAAGLLAHLDALTAKQLK